MATEFQKFHRLQAIDCDQGAVRAVRYNVDGSYCFTCGSDKKLKLWNPHSGLLLKTYCGHADEVTDSVGSCESSHIVSGSLDKSLIYWDVTTGAPLRRFHRHASGVNCVCLNDDSSVAFSGGRDNIVHCWDIRTRRTDPVQTITDARDCITSVMTTDHQIIFSSLDSTVRHYDIRACQIVEDYLKFPIVYMVLTRDEQCFVVSCQDSIVRLVDSNTGCILSEYKRQSSGDYHIECGVLSNDTHIISGTSHGYAVIWDILEGKVIQHINIGNGVVHSLATHPNLNEILLAKGREIYLYSNANISTEN